jgi:SdrD B-like protein/peptidase C39-like protein
MRTPTPSATPTAAPTRVAAAATVTPAAQTGNRQIAGSVFVDDNASGQLTDTKQRLMNVEVVLTHANGLSRTTHTDASGAFTFDALPTGTYHVAVTLPADYVPTTDEGQDVTLDDDADTSPLLFGLITREAAGLPPDGTEPDAGSDDEQIIALASVTSLPLRFAEGRDLMNQLQRRALGDGLIWLGVPFRSQIDGGDFQYVNCGPASLTMVLAGFGLEVGPSQVRDYLNNLIDNFDTDLGTSLDVLSRIATQAGLTPMDLYSDQGGYRNWSTDAVRWHVQQGHPVITLVKYRDLPGHTSSLSQFDHYIVITGLTPNGFIYNDGAFTTTLGYGLEISDVELEYAWENSSIPHHAVALGLAPDKKTLTFPELPRKPRTTEVPSAARGIRRLANADAASVARPPLVLTPVVTATSAASVLSRDAWEDDPALNVPALPDDPGTPMGLKLEPTQTQQVEAAPGPGAQVPKLIALVGLGWTLWLLLRVSARLGLSLYAIPWRRAVMRMYAGRYAAVTRGEDLG